MAECIFHVYVLAPQKETFPKNHIPGTQPTAFIRIVTLFPFLWMKHLLKKTWFYLDCRCCTGSSYYEPPKKCTYHMGNPSSDYPCICIFMIRPTQFFDVCPIDSAFFGGGGGNICIFNDQWSLIYMTVCSTKIDTGTSFSVGTATVLLFMSSMTAGSHSSTGRKKHASPIWQDFSRCKTKHKVGPSPVLSRVITPLIGVITSITHS